MAIIRKRKMTRVKTSVTAAIMTKLNKIDQALKGGSKSDSELITPQIFEGLRTNSAAETVNDGRAIQVAQGSSNSIDLKPDIKPHTLRAYSMQPSEQQVLNNVTLSNGRVITYYHPPKVALTRDGWSFRPSPGTTSCMKPSMGVTQFRERRHFASMQITQAVEAPQIDRPDDATVYEERCDPLQESRANILSQIPSCLDGTVADFAKLGYILSNAELTVHELQSAVGQLGPVRQIDSSSFSESIDSCSSMDELKASFKQLALANTFLLNTLIKQQEEMRQKIEKKPWSADYTVQLSNLQLIHTITPVEDFPAICLNHLMCHWRSTSAQSAHSLNDAVKYMLLRICDPYSAIQQYSLRLSSRGQHSKMFKDLPITVKDELVEFLADLCAYGAKNPQIDLSLPLLSVQDVVNVNADDLNDRCKQIRQMRAEATNFIATVITPCLQQCLNEVRRAYAAAGPNIDPNIPLRWTRYTSRPRRPRNSLVSLESNDINEEQVIFEEHDDHQGNWIASRSPRIEVD